MPGSSEVAYRDWRADPSGERRTLSNFAPVVWQRGTRRPMYGDVRAGSHAYVSPHGHSRAPQGACTQRRKVSCTSSLRDLAYIAE